MKTVAVLIAVVAVCFCTANAFPTEDSSSEDMALDDQQAVVMMVPMDDGDMDTDASKLWLWAGNYGDDKKSGKLIKNHHYKLYKPYWYKEKKN